jgi:HPt (histidine-containing phosphotransfer) domain-containing protein
VDDRTELFPLFLTEARSRVERLLTLAGRVDVSPVAAGDARLELHTLKGACRLMGLVELTSLCAEGEELMDSVDAGTGSRVRALAERFRALLAQLESRSEAPA